MAVFRGAKDRDDAFTGSARADRFEFDPRDLTSGDTIFGGDGRAVDVLAFSVSGAISASALADVSAIERIELGDGGANSLILTTAFVTSANGGRVQVAGGSGDDFIYAADLAAGAAIDFVSRGGTDYVFGGAGDDTFSFAIDSLDASDRVVAGAGANTLILTGSGSVSADQLHGMEGIGSVRLGDGGISIAVSDALIAQTTNSVLTVAGGAGTDRIDASGMTIAANQLTLLGGAGDDVILGGLSYWSSTIDGGEGADTISAGIADVVYDAGDISVSVDLGTLLIHGAATIDLTRTDDQSLGDTNVVRGFASADASASKVAVTLVGGDGARLIGGNAADTLTGGSTIRGGKGADILTGNLTGTIFVLGAHEFARGETIRGVGGNDTLTITGENDIRGGDVTGIETLVIGSSFPQSFGILRATAAQLIDVQFLYASDSRSVLDITMARGDRLLPNLKGGNYFSFIDVTGSDRADVIRIPGIQNVHARAGDDDILAVGDIFGEAGDDSITTNILGERKVDGGVGSDSLTVIGDSFSFAGANLVTFDLSNPNNQLVMNGSAAHITLRFVENVDLSRFDASFYSGTFVLKGDLGANVLTGASSRSTIVGMAGDDVLTGGENNDILSGGDGHDTIAGGYGQNVMSGGAGSDTFVYREQTHLGFPPGAPGDTIKDFQAAEDTFAFASDVFKIAGKTFDTRLVSDGHGGNADLLIATGVTLSNGDDVVEFLRGLTAPNTDHGLFIAGRNAAGETELFYAQTRQAASYLINEVANLGKIGDPAQVLTLDAFGFI